ncbi:MAG: DUF2807 domain-containing protein [Bacteroidetes bacterium]|nr:DUF2807 domain-containing protein [Bacteroidota bacterium]
MKTTVQTTGTWVAKFIPAIDSLRMNKILILLAFSVFVFSSCEKMNNRIDGQGPYVSDEISINNIDDLRVSTYAEVYISKGEKSLRIEGESNILAALNVEEKNGLLEIGKNNKFGDMKPLKIYFATPKLNAIHTAGDICVSSNDIFITHSFKINMSGVGNLNMKIQTDELSTNLSGETDIEISGTSTKHDLNVSGLCEIACFNLLTKETDIIASGDSNIEVQVEEKLNVVISGSSNIYYKGIPVISQEISGSGKIISAN